MTDHWVAGIGSRKTPLMVQMWIEQILGRLHERGYGLRSGGAQGADHMFESVARRIGMPVEIFVPRHRRYDGEIGWNEIPSEIQQRALTMAQEHHPAWESVRLDHRLLHARNGFQVLGRYLNHPARAVLCWSPYTEYRDGKICNVRGGTGQAVRIAYRYGIPVYNLYETESRQKLSQVLGIDLS